MRLYVNTETVDHLLTSLYLYGVNRMCQHNYTYHSSKYICFIVKEVFCKLCYSKLIFELRYTKTKHKLKRIFVSLLIFISAFIDYLFISYED